MELNFQNPGQQKQRQKTLIKYDRRLISITASHGTTQSKHLISNHYLFTAFQVSDKTVSECFQMSERLLQMIQSFFISSRWVFRIFHVIIWSFFSWFLRKMFDCLNSFLSHFYPGFNWQLKKIAQLFIHSLPAHYYLYYSSAKRLHNTAQN